MASAICGKWQLSNAIFLHHSLYHLRSSSNDTKMKVCALVFKSIQTKIMMIMMVRWWLWWWNKLLRSHLISFQVLIFTLDASQSLMLWFLFSFYFLIKTTNCVRVIFQIESKEFKQIYTFESEKQPNKQSRGYIEVMLMTIR